MQNAQNPCPEGILEWLQQEVAYRPHGRYVSSPDRPVPSLEDLKKVCRGNMLPIWEFLLRRVKSDKTVAKIRKNILVHGSVSSDARWSEDDEGADDTEVRKVVVGKGRKGSDVKGKGRLTPAKAGGKGEEIRQREKVPDASELRDKASRECDAAQKEVERLRHVLQRLVKEFKGRMLEISREEAERRRILDEKSNYRHKQVLLEAYDQNCTQTVNIFAEYQHHLHCYLDQARDAQTGNGGGQDKTPEQETVYATVKGGNKLAGSQIVIETAQERSIAKACEALAEHLTDRVQSMFPAYNGDTAQGCTHVEDTKLGVDLDADIPSNVKDIALGLIRNPPQLLHAMTSYTARFVNSLHLETEKIDLRSDAERLRYRFENSRIIDIASLDANESSYFQNKINIGFHASNRSTYKQLQERQKAHVQLFMATEEAFNNAVEAKKVTKELIKQINGSDDAAAANLVSLREGFQNTQGLRQVELEVWSKERDLAGLRASVKTLTAEVQRLKKTCEERKEAKDALQKKRKKIEEFDARRTQLESVYTALIRGNQTAAASWEQHSVAAREYSANTIIPVCMAVQSKATEAYDLVKKEVDLFHRSPDNRVYMLPATPQALLSFMSASGSAGPEAVAAAEKNAELLTARAGARDPSAIPTVCRISAALQYHAGLEASDAGLASMLKSLGFCLKLCGSEANLLEDLLKAINQVHMLQDLAGNGHALLSSPNTSLLEYGRTESYCLSMAGEQEKTSMQKWFPELKAAVQDAQRCLEDCKRIRGLVNEWWEQPASMAVDWITVDGQNVAAWLAHVKQLQMAFYDKQLS